MYIVNGGVLLIVKGAFYAEAVYKNITKRAAKAVAE